MKFYFDEKHNTFYIRTELILPNMKGISFQERRKIMKEAFNLSYEERLKKFCKEDTRKEIEKEISKYPGCKISEFTV